VKKKKWLECNGEQLMRCAKTLTLQGASLALFHHLKENKDFTNNEKDGLKAGIILLDNKMIRRPKGKFIHYLTLQPPLPPNQKHSPLLFL